MDSGKRAFGIVMAANFESVVVLFMAHHGAEYLSSRFPEITFMTSATYLLGIVVIAVLWFRMFRHLYRMSRRDDVLPSGVHSNESDPKDESSN